MKSLRSFLDEIAIKLRLISLNYFGLIVSSTESDSLSTYTFPVQFTWSLDTWQYQKNLKKNGRQDLGLAGNFFLYNESRGNNLKRKENLLLGYREYEGVHVNTTIKFLIPGVAKTKCNNECQKLYENKLSQNLQRSNNCEWIWNRCIDWDLIFRVSVWLRFKFGWKHYSIGDILFDNVEKTKC